jgi:hypothetical protein
MKNLLDDMIDTIEIEYDDIIEYQLDTFLFLFYSKNQNKFFIKYLNLNLDEEIIEVTEQDFPITINNFIITKDDFNKLISYL